MALAQGITIKREIVYSVCVDGITLVTILTSLLDTPINFITPRAPLPRDACDPMAMICLAIHAKGQLASTP